MAARWTEEEEGLLKLFYLDYDKELILRHLPNRSWGSICTRAHKLKLSRYKFGSNERRFWKNVDVQQDACWNWTASCNSHGYGAFRSNEKHIVRRVTLKEKTAGAYNVTQTESVKDVKV